MMKNLAISFVMIGILFLESCLNGCELNISEQSSLIDHPISIEINGLTPNASIKLVATAYDYNFDCWQSWANFKADEFGKVDVGSQTPIDGSYHIKDVMGLFWSMKSSTNNNRFFKTKKNTIDITLQVVIDDIVVETKVIHRLKKLPGVKKIPIKKDGIIGILFLPINVEKPSVIITLNGSQGTINESIAQLLASHGFAVLGLGYFGMDSLPKKLENIPMEYFQNAIHWIQSRSDLDGEHIGLYGLSRGAELSLILGSLFPKSITAITAALPSSVINPGLGTSALSNAWTYQGKPIGPTALLQLDNISTKAGDSSANPIEMVSCFIKGMNSYPNEFAAAAIPVEKIDCPLLLISAGEDKMWPSWIYAENIKNRLDQFHSEISCTVLNYPKAGHLIGIPFLPSRTTLYYNSNNHLWYSMGGSALENELASQDSWKKIIHFFDTTLNRR